MKCCRRLNGINFFFPFIGLNERSTQEGFLELKAVKKKAPKKRASAYEPKVKFEDILAISTMGAGTKKKKVKND